MRLKSRSDPLGAGSVGRSAVVFLLFQQILSLLKAAAKKIEKPICAGSTTGPIIIHYTTASAQCKNLKFGLFEIFSLKKNFKKTQELATALIDAHNVIKMCAPAAPPIRLRIRTRTLNPNPIFNPNRNKVFERKQKRHRNIGQHRVIFAS